MTITYTEVLNVLVSTQHNTTETSCLTFHLVPDVGGPRVHHSIDGELLTEQQRYYGDGGLLVLRQVRYVGHHLDVCKNVSLNRVILSRCENVTITYGILWFVISYDIVMWVIILISQKCTTRQKFCPNNAPGYYIKNVAVDGTFFK